MDIDFKKLAEMGVEIFFTQVFRDNFFHADMHPDQETLKEMMQEVGFERCDYDNLTGGIVALHRGFKF